MHRDSSQLTRTAPNDLRQSFSLLLLLVRVESSADSSSFLSSHPGHPCSSLQVASGDEAGHLRLYKMVFIFI